MSSILDLSVKEPFLDAIIRGAKRTEYREMSKYWIERLVDVSKYNESDIEKLCIAIYSDAEPTWIHYDQIRFHCGDRTATYELKDIACYPHHRVFALHLGDAV